MIQDKNRTMLSKADLEFEAKTSQVPAVASATRNVKPLTYPGFDLTAPAEEMHWMAFAAYNQK